MSIIGTGLRYFGRNYKIDRIKGKKAYLSRPDSRMTITMDVNKVHQLRKKFGVVK